MKIWLLPRDLLHCLYSEWLAWLDLSALDIACLSIEKDRKEWLSSVSSQVILTPPSPYILTKTEHLFLPQKKFINYYQWLSNRKVLVRDGFPMRLSVLEDLLYCFDLMTFCPTLHSIVILEESNGPICHQPNLSLFFNYCRHLQEVKVVHTWISTTTTNNHNNNQQDQWSSRTTSTSTSTSTSTASRQQDNNNNTLYTILNKELKNNSLVKLKIDLSYYSNNTNKMIIAQQIGQLLSHHMHSVQELEVHDDNTTLSSHHGIIYLLLEEIIRLQLNLHVLHIDILFERCNSDGRGSSRCPIIPLLLQDLSLAGRSLETLVIQYSDNDFILTDDILIQIGHLCPKLQKLSWNYGVNNSSLCSIKEPSQIYRLCPNFLCLYLWNFKIEVDKKKKSVTLTILTYRHNVCLEECIECLVLLLDRIRGQDYQQVGLAMAFCELESNEWMLVKDKVGVRLTSLEGRMSEDVLISLLPELPLLQRLKVVIDDNWPDDRLFVTIAEYGQNLIELFISLSEVSISFGFNDKIVIEMFKKCKTLEVLHIPEVGYESILATIQYLPRLRKVYFQDVTAKKEEVITLLLHCREVTTTWSLIFKEGVIQGNGWSFIFQNSSRCWVEL